MVATRRGRPLKFGRPARVLALTLPHDVVSALQRIHPDPAWAIVSLFEGPGKTDDRAVPVRSPVVELAQSANERRQQRQLTRGTQLGGWNGCTISRNTARFSQVAA